MKRSSLLLLVTLFGASILNNSAVDAVPVSRLLSSHQPIIAVQQPQQQPKAPQAQAPPQVSAGRIQFKSSSSSLKRRASNKKIGKLFSKSLLESPEPLILASWYHRSDRQPRDTRLSSSLQGHAVLDEEDDDAGNELLDTETDGLIRPDDDDTIEGEILEEEDDEEEDVDDEDEEDNRPQARFVNPEAIEAFARLASNEGWIKENGLQDGDFVPDAFEDEEDGEDIEEEVNVSMSKYGGKTAAADLAAEEP